MTAVRRVALQEVATIERDTIEPSRIKAGTLYVGLENIEPGGKFVGVRSVERGELASNKFTFTPNHLLYGKLRPYLAKIARPNFYGICSTDILPVLPGPELERSYLSWYLLTPRMVALATSRANGINLPRLSPLDLAEMKIPLPPLPEQRRIASILDKADELRAKRRVAFYHLDSLTQSIFQEMFGDPVTNPRGWKTTSLGDVLISIRNGVNREQKIDGEGWPITRIETISDGTIAPSRVRWIDPEPELLAEFRLEVGDILFSHINSIPHIGKTALYKGSPEILIHGINLLRLRCRSDAVEPAWLICLLKHHLTRTYFRTRCKPAVNQASLNQQDIQRLRMYLPPQLLQRKFVRLLMGIEALCNVQRVGLCKLDEFFGSLEHRAFQGGL